MAYYVYVTADNIVVGRYRTQSAADTAAAASTALTAYQGDISTELQVGQAIDPATGRAAAETRLSAADRLTADWRYRLHRAWQHYCDPAHPTARQDWWSEVASDAAVSQAAVTATTRWAYHQIALGDLIAARTWASSATDAAREMIIRHIVGTIVSLARTWYGVMVADQTKRGQWGGSSTADGAALYSDIVTSAIALTPRTPDGVWRAMIGATIPAGFQPDTPTLR